MAILSCREISVEVLKFEKLKTNQICISKFLRILIGRKLSVIPGFFNGLSQLTRVEVTMTMKEPLLDEDLENEDTEIYVPAKPHIDPALRRIPGPCGFCGGIGDDYR